MKTWSVVRGAGAETEDGGGVEGSETAARMVARRPLSDRSPMVLPCILAAPAAKEEAADANAI